MKSPNTRRPLRILHDEVVQHETVLENRPWQIKMDNEQIRGPLAVHHIQSLLEVGQLTADARIARVGEDLWQPLKDHPVWAEVQPKQPVFNFSGGRAPEKVEVSTTDFSTPVSPAMKAGLQMKQMRELNQVHHRVTHFRFAKLVRLAREVLIFFAFITFGDACTSFPVFSTGIIRMGVSLCILTAATVYYAWRIFWG
jgi:hypothetical protein